MNKNSESALVLSLVLLSIVVLVGNVITSTWHYSDDGLCDACEEKALYHVEVVGTGRVTNEFCGGHAFLWGAFNPWAPAEGLYGLHLLSLFVLFLFICAFSFVGFTARSRILKSSRQRIWKVAAALVFILGSTMFIGGIAYATAHPELPLMWKSESEVLANEEVMEITAGWRSRNEVLVNNLTTSPKYESREELIDEVISVWRTYSYDIQFFSWSAINFTISGNAIEQSYPQTRFNFYIFDDENFYNWTNGADCKAYFETKDEKSVSFNFSIMSPMPSEEVSVSLYFVVEECVLDVKPTVSVIATACWCEKCFWFEYIDYHEFNFPSSEETCNIIIEGTVTEIDGNRFNFYIMDNYNFYDFTYDLAYTAFYESKDSSVSEFSVPLLTVGEGSPSICFVVENPNLDIGGVVDFYANVSWIEKWATGYDSSEFKLTYMQSHSLGLQEINETKEFMLEGSAFEISDKKSNLHIFNYTNYINWINNKTHQAYYQKNNMTNASFSIPISKAEALSTFYFVAENPLINKNETVKLSATIKWKELTTTFGGWELGAVISFVGSMIIIAAGLPAALMFSSPKLSDHYPIQQASLHERKGDKSNQEFGKTKALAVSS